MCTTCGCSDHGLEARVGERMGSHSHEDGHSRDHAHSHEHGHSHEHVHPHDRDHVHAEGDVHAHDHAHSRSPTHAVAEPSHPSSAARIVELEREVLAKNDRAAERNRDWLASRDILALNLMSSPGAGKTTLLERTIRELGAELGISVVEGDQETVFDAERIRATGCPTLQLNTGSGCHLEAEMLGAALEKLGPAPGSVVMIENVGNLVCPALFDLGEYAKAVVLSVTEGEDKPLKYPYMFRACRLMILNKIDLLPHVQFDVERCVAHARRVNPAIEVIRVSATKGEGLDDWYAWLRRRVGNPAAASGLG